MVKPEKVTSILNNLRGHREKLEKLAAFSEEEFLNDFTRVESAKHLLQVSIESCLDIAHHIVADGGYRTPEDSYDAFVVLNEEKILPDDFMPTLREMVSFRNRVVWTMKRSIAFCRAISTTSTVLPLSLQITLNAMRRTGKSSLTE